MDVAPSRCDLDRWRSQQNLDACPGKVSAQGVSLWRGHGEKHREMCLCGDLYGT